MNPTRLTMRPLPFIALAVALAVSLAPPPLAARPSTWTDLSGATFRGDPAGILGPFALFNTGEISGRRVLLSNLGPDECRRFFRESAARPPVAAQWAQAKGRISGDLPGHVMHVADQKLVPVDLTGRPEPDVIVLMFGSYNDGDSWGMIHAFIPTYQRIQQVYPGRCETVFYGVRDKAEEHQSIATQTYMPWLVTDFSVQRGMDQINRFAPAEGILLMALSRDGVPLVSSRAENVEAIKQFIDALSDVLRAIDPANPASWHERQHYLDAVRPEQFAHAHADAELIGSPLRGDGLRQRGVTQVKAHLELGADGHVTTATVLPEGGVTPAMTAPLADALRKGLLFSPAIEQGQPVASSYEYSYETPPPSAAKPADIAWLRGDGRIEIAIGSWLVLRPIPVPAAVFSSVDHVDANGVTVFTAVSVSQEKISRSSQMNAFNSDFFTDPATVLPAEGDTQVVDEAKLKWERVKSEDGYVNMQTGINQDYCVGYAWTELDSPQALDGWLGIGSDDGLKIWLNGKLVHDRWVRRISRIDDDIVPLHLAAGKNRLLIKIQNATGDWSFIGRLRVKAPAAPKP